MILRHRIHVKRDEMPPVPYQNRNRKTCRCGTSIYSKCNCTRLESAVPCLPRVTIYFPRQKTRCRTGHDGRQRYLITFVIMAKPAEAVEWRGMQLEKLHKLESNLSQLGVTYFQKYYLKYDSLVVTFDISV